jgi:outer membrane protein OmpA-like peptidoglycan-associated protein
LPSRKGTGARHALYLSASKERTIMRTRLDIASALAGVLLLGACASDERAVYDNAPPPAPPDASVSDQSSDQNAPPAADEAANADNANPSDSADNNAPATPDASEQADNDEGANAPGGDTRNRTADRRTSAQQEAMNDRDTDQEERALRDRSHHRFSMRREGRNLRLEMQGDVLFALDSAELRPGARNLIHSISEELVRHPNSAIDVNGYTDTSGTSDHNQELSEARADAVADELERDGVDAQRLHTQGFGETELAVATPDGVREARNRRVEIVIEPLTN